MSKCPTCGQDMRVVRRDVDNACILTIGALAFFGTMATTSNVWASLFMFIAGMMAGAYWAVQLEKHRSRNTHAKVPPCG